MNHPLIDRQLDHRLKLYAAKGGKVSRRATVRRVRAFIEFCQRPAAQIGRRQVHEFFEQRSFSPATRRDYHRAICLLWRLLGRSGEPPRPRSPMA
ncbi:hypothetical protein MKP05_20910 [Halomonas sp. EGI 63088]|uniref:Core-binding (CB) domain-containing protein n=1 Tax=Halomonas flagellata TaxID=2920385 RepID=A0ABS9S0C5_9GAMM|nr:hypothetical protein [Halomonas flagellata]MCH4565563.1 hypothetical protein [Halomonas flagellata]